MKSVKCKLQSVLKFSIFILFLSLSFVNPKLTFSQEPVQEKQEQYLPVYATVLTDKVNIRAGGGLNFEILGQLNKGNRIVVLGEEYGWYKLKLPKHAAVFVHKDYVEETGTVTANKLRVRAGSGINFNVLGILRKGEVVDILNREGDWLKIAPPDNCIGWIKEEHLKLSEDKFVPAKYESHQARKKKKIEVRGTIDDLGKIVNRPGTHKLVKGKKILYYLKSKGVDLNSYIYQKVYVIGNLIHLKNSPYPLIDVEEIRTR